MAQILLSEMDKKIISNIILTLKAIFIIGSWIMEYLHVNDSSSYEINLFWRDFNEYSTYALIVIAIFELTTKNFKQFGLTSICLITTILLRQTVTGGV